GHSFLFIFCSDIFLVLIRFYYLRCFCIAFCCTLFPFFSIGHCSISYPLAFLPRFYTGGKPFFIAGAVSVHHVPEFLPVYLPKIIMSSLFVPFQFIIRQFHAQYITLLYGYIYKPLAQFIIGEPFHPPAHALCCVRAVI